MEILRIEDLTFAYPSCEKNAVDGVSLSVNEGEFIVLCGASGCGKTTLLKLLKRELSPAGKKAERSFSGAWTPKNFPTAKAPPRSVLSCKIPKNRS